MNLIEIWKNRRKEDVLSNKKFLHHLKKTKNKSINTMADRIHEEVFKQLDCLDCGNCCKSIAPIINEMDIKRAAKFMGIRPNDFKHEYVIIDRDGDMVLKTSPCPFLEADNECSIYDGRPRACSEYPHTDNFEFLKNIRLHEINSQYCPAVFHIVERLKEIHS